MVVSIDTFGGGAPPPSSIVLFYVLSVASSFGITARPISSIISNVVLGPPTYFFGLPLGFVAGGGCLTLKKPFSDYYLPHL
jgi:hypothetical protein